MNIRPTVKIDDGIMIGDTSYSSTERDRIDLVKAPSFRLNMFAKTSSLKDPMKAAERAEIDGEEEKKRRKKKPKKWTKPEGKPKRPLSAYNIFFAEERIRMLGKDVPTAEQEAQKKKVHCKTHGKISFAVLARTIGARWKALESEDRKTFEDRAQTEKARYLRELAIWKEEQKLGKAVGEESKMSSGVQDVVSTITDKKSPMQMQQVSGVSKSGPEVPAIPLPRRMTADANANANAESLAARRTIALADTNGSLTATGRISPRLSHGTNGNDSNLIRLILEEENRRRYLSLLNLQSSPLPDFSQGLPQRYSPLDRSLLSLNGASQRIQTPVDSYTRFRSTHAFDLASLSADRSVLRNIEGRDSLPFQEYNSRYLRALQEYAMILQLEERHKRMMGN